MTLGGTYSVFMHLCHCRISPGVIGGASRPIDVYSRLDLRVELINKWNDAVGIF